MDGNLLLDKPLQVVDDEDDQLVTPRLMHDVLSEWCEILNAGSAVQAQAWVLSDVSHYERISAQSRGLLK